MIVRKIYRSSGFALVTAAMLPGYLAHRRLTRIARRPALHDRWIGTWSRALLGLFGASVHVDGEVPVSTTGRLVISNHRSTLDIATLLGTFGGALVSRSDIKAWPIIGAAARSAGTIFVNRTDTVSGATAIRAIRERLRGGGTVSIFPEGTTSSSDVVLPFHAGTFVAALNTDALVVPVGIAFNEGSQASFVDETFGAHLLRMSGAPPTRIVLAIGSPLEVEKGVRAAALRDQAYEAVQALVNKARAISRQLDSDSPLL